MASAKPNTREGWMKHYISRFNKTELEICATQALWFYLNILAFGDRSYSPRRAKDKTA